MSTPVDSQTAKPAPVTPKMHTGERPLPSLEPARYESSNGLVIYKLPVMAFPGHVTNCYLALADKLTLIDTGSGIPESNKSMLTAFENVRTKFGEKCDLPDVKRVILTHGHIDHFGGLNFVSEKSGAEVGIHLLDMSTIRDFQERLIVSSRNLQVYLSHAGLDEATVKDYVERNKWSKHMFKAQPVDFTFDEEDVVGGTFEIFHAPGHCPGQVVMRCGDVLFTADHVLARTTPNQSPESIIHYNGLGHYFGALKKVRKFEGIRLALGGHEEEMHDLQGRIDGIVAFHETRLARTLEICSEPKSIKQIAAELFPKARDYHIILALFEAGAHVEYLHERGKLVVENIEEVERESNPVLRYQRAD